MFQLPAFTFATLSNLNPRIEKHGDESVSAVDLSVSYDAPNTILEQFAPGLLDAFYKEAEMGDDSQDAIEGLEITGKPLLRFPQMAPIKFTNELVGHRFAIDYGLDEDSAIVLPSVDVGKFSLELKEGGTVSMKFRVQANQGLTEQIIGKLAMLISQEVRIQLTPPEMKPEAEADELSLVLPGMDEEDKPLTAEDVFIGGVVPGEAAAVH